MPKGTSVCAAVCLLASLSVTVTVAAFAFANDAAKGAGAGKVEGGAAEAPAASADEAKMMEAWMALSKPGKQHAALKRLEGEYDVDVEMVMKPGAPPMKSSGKAKYAMIMDGRYLHADYTGESMGMAFRGASLMGYDNAKKKYFSLWIDSMGTGILMAEGTGSDDGKVTTLAGEYDEPVTRQKRKFRWVTTVESDDRHTFDWIDADKDGKNEFRMMRNTYTRAK